MKPKVGKISDNTLIVITLYVPLETIMIMIDMKNRNMTTNTP